ncbi:MAG: DUF1294 domain-containing protein [Silicimonas sp.]|nr:DUF1294 domain-containing protein [Silicimonas sp.]
MTELLLIYFGTINLVTFLCALGDRLLARYGWFRVPEKALLALAWVGGSPAAKLVQILSGHKSLAMNYTTSLHLIVMLQVCLSLAVWGAVYTGRVKTEEATVLETWIGHVAQEEEEEPPKPKRFGPGS